MRANRHRAIMSQGAAAADINAPAAMPDATARAKAAIVAAVNGKDRIDTGEIVEHLLREHRIGVTSAWVKSRLLGMGWQYAGHHRGGFYMTPEARP